MKIAYLSFLVGIIISLNSFGQTAEHYFEKVSAPYHSIAVEVWGYTKAAKNSPDLASQESKRSSVKAQCEKALQDLEKLSAWENDAKLNTAIASYYKSALTALSLSYSELSPLEKSKMSSVEAMQSFQKKEHDIRESLYAANEQAVSAVDAFSKQYKINQSSDNTELLDRMKKTNQTYDYYDVVYNLNLKCHLIENQLIEAVEAKEVDKIEKLSHELVLAANEGIGKLNHITPYLGKDDRLRAPTRQLLDFYKKEGAEHVPQQVGFFKDQEHFEAHVEEMKKKQASKQMKKEDVENFNKEKIALKAKTELFNRENEKVNARRTYVVNVWNNDAVNFIEINVPK